MATAPSSPILIWSPGGGFPGGPVSNPPVYSQAGITPLVIGQNYVDVVFGSIQTDTTWVLVECDVTNAADLTPLNIWPGIITNRTISGFRVYVNGLPDTGNYYLHWAVSGINIAPSATSTYLLSGPSTGFNGIASDAFTVSLPPSTTILGSVIVTPTDSGGGGTFSPSTVTLTTAVPTATFTYTAASTGTKTVSVTNNGGLTDPSGVVYTVTVAPLPTYTLSGPTGGVVSVASTNFTVTLATSPAISGTVVVTPNDAGIGVGAGTFTPASVSLTTAAPVATFTYTPIATGSKIIAVTNNRGLTDPATLNYTVGAVPLADGDLVSSWPDSSGNGHVASQTGSSRPTYKTNIVNSKPVVRFTAAGTSNLAISPAISGASPWTVFVVRKPAGATMYSFCSGSQGGPVAVDTASGFVGVVNRDTYGIVADTYSGAFHVFTTEAVGTGNALWIDGTSQTLTTGSVASTGDLDSMGKYNGSTYSDGDIAEIIAYNVTLSSTDRANIEKYLGTKYGITVAGGSAVTPDTVTGLAAWWKADAL